MAVTPAGSGGRGPVPSGNGRGAGVGERGRRAARSPRGVRGAGPGGGRGYGPRRGGWAARSWARSVYISARVTSAEKRAGLTRLPPRGGQGGGPAPEEARPGRVRSGGRLRPAPGQGGQLGAGPGRLGRLGVAWRAGGQCPPEPSRAGAGPPPLTYPSLAAGARGRLSSAILLSSRSSPAPCRHFPYSPGRGRLVSVWNLFLNKTGTGSVLRAPSGSSLREAGPWGPGSGPFWGGRGRRSAGRVLRGPPSPLSCSSWAILLHVSKGRRKYSNTPRGIQIAQFRLVSRGPVSRALFFFF